MRICVLDLGGMSFHLLHARVLSTGALVQLGDMRLPTRLGANTMQTGVLDPGRFEAGLADLGRLCQEARRLSPDQLVVIATSAIRAASNGQSFVAKARELFGVDITVLTSHQEAELTYRGAISADPSLSGSLAIVDLGGGSCEIAFGRGPTYESSLSADIGVLSLREVFGIEDCIGPIKTGAIAEVVRIALRPPKINKAQSHPDRLIFASGTARAVAALARSAFGDVLPPGRMSQAQATMMKDFVYNRMPANFVEYGVDLHRAETIAVAAIVVETLMASFHCNEAEFSTRGLREGVALCEWERCAAMNAQAIAAEVSGNEPRI